MWSWLAVLVSFYSMVFSARGYFVRSFAGLQATLAWLLLVSVAATAAGSFRRERETGVLELLLVSPLNAWKIIGGRVRGVWGQFAPAVLLLLSVWMFAATFLPGLKALEATWFSIGFLTVPMIGLYYSLAKPHFLSAFLWTMLMGYAFPTLLVNSVAWRMRLIQFAGLAPTGSATNADILQGPIWGFTQLALALGFAWLLHRNLDQRRFALERPAG
jgi:ABC-type Na+ efflux pump permease subunit